MKGSSVFVIDKLHELYSSIEGLRIRYEYRKDLSSHIIEVLPLNIFETDTNYILKELDIQDDFEFIFGTKEDILFISSDSLMAINSPEFSLGYNNK